MPRPSVDLAVVGAGPAGVAAAAHAARAGRSVVLVDKATFPRDKCCGDGLTTLALRELADLGLDAAAVASWTDVDRARLRSPSGRVVTLPLPAGRGRYAAVARRLDLDDALVERAAAAGAEVREGWPVTGVDAGPDGVVLRGPGAERLAARFVVAADGMWSPTRRGLGLTPPGWRGEWHAMRGYLHSGTAAARDLWVWFEPDLLPGYAWSFPLPDGRVNLGFGVRRHGRLDGKALARTWRELSRRAPVADVIGDARPEGGHLAWPIPARVPRAVLHHGRVLFVGDAAAACDPLTGEGIGQALVTGRLAARAVAADGPDAGASYADAARRELVADHRMAAACAALLASPTGARGALRLVDTGDWTRRRFARWMFEDEPRAVVATPHRWHRRFLDRDGASL